MRLPASLGLVDITPPRKTKVVRVGKLIKLLLIFKFSGGFMEENEVLIVDSNAIIAYDILLSLTNAVTTLSVIEELKDRNSRLKAEIAMSMGKLKVMEPNPKYLNSVKGIAEREGDSCKLSMTDLTLLALAFQLRESGHKVTILTDDYAIMNVAQKLGLSYKPIKTTGIKTVLRWIRYCPNCGVVYKGKLNTCPTCGSKLRIKGVKRKILSRG